VPKSAANAEEPIVVVLDSKGKVQHTYEIPGNTCTLGPTGSLGPNNGRWFVVQKNNAYESPALEGMIVDEGVIVEIVRPGTGDPVPAGEVGEVVVTTFNRDYPMIRFGTGDLSAVLPGMSPCGRTNMRIKGWLGRADQTTKVKGMFVHPEQVAEVAKRHAGLGRVRLVVARQGEQDIMTLRAESATADAGLKAKLAETLQAVTKLKGEVELVAPGSLPNDGKVIADERTYSQ
jgi:phenylacetate-CoA ligase